VCRSSLCERWLVDGVFGIYKEYVAYSPGISVSLAD
jgi:hypothetical protein